MRTIGKAIVAAATLAALASNAAAETRWTLFTPFTTNDKPTQLYRQFAEDVAAATKDELVIEVFSAGELPYKNSDVLKALASNQVQIADLAIGPVAGDVPELNVFVLPFICTSMDQFYEAAGAALPIIDARLRDRFGVRALAAWTMPPQEIWLAEPVSSIDDLQGRKIRTWNRTQVEMLDLLGATGVAITPAEVIPALQRGVVDGAITAVVPAYDWKFYEVVGYGYMLDFTMTNQLIAVHEGAYQALAPEVREALAETARAWQGRFREAIAAAADEAKAKLTEEGMTLIEPAPADLAKARETTRPIWERWAEQNGEIARRLLEEVGTACGA